MDFRVVTDAGLRILRDQRLALAGRRADDTTGAGTDVPCRAVAAAAQPVLFDAVSGRDPDIIRQHPGVIRGLGQNRTVDHVPGQGAARTGKRCIDAVDIGVEARGMGGVDLEAANADLMAAVPGADRRQGVAGTRGVRRRRGSGNQAAAAGSGGRKIVVRAAGAHRQAVTCDRDVGTQRGAGIGIAADAGDAGADGDHPDSDAGCGGILFRIGFGTDRDVTRQRAAAADSGVRAAGVVHHRNRRTETDDATGAGDRNDLRAVGVEVFGPGFDLQIIAGLDLRRRTCKRLGGAVDHPDAERTADADEAARRTRNLDVELDLVGRSNRDIVSRLDLAAAADVSAGLVE